jgi:diacylglycerol kinase family enzyme
VDVATAAGELMLLMAGVGLDADVIHALQTSRTGPIKRLDYLPAAARAAWSYVFPEIVVTVDGQAIGGPTRGVAICANVPEYGLGVPLLPEAVADDGLLDVAVLPAGNRLELIELTLAAIAGRHHLTRGTRLVRGRHVRIETMGDPVAVQVDGEAAGTTPLEMTVGTRQARFLLPG